MAGFSKLFSSILTSTLWGESHATVRVWIAMLAACNAEGLVEGSVPGFAHLARVTVQEMRDALAILTAPDPESRTQDHEGRRLEAIGGGWLILNYRKYREAAQGQEGSNAPAMRAWRKKKREEAFMNEPEPS